MKIIYDETLPIIDWDRYETLGESIDELKDMYKDFIDMKKMIDSMIYIILTEAIWNDNIDEELIESVKELLR